MTDGGQAGRLSRAKVVILGRGNCGKTALCVRFITKRFIGEYDHKKEVTYRCRKIVDKEAIDLEILDTANKKGVGPAASSLEASIKWGDGFLIIYSITDRSSFEAVSHLKRLIDHVKQTLGIPTVIVANKSDMENGRVVRTEEGQSLAGDLRCPFYELSVAESSAAVEAAFSQLVREVRLEFHKHLMAMDKRSRVLQMSHALKSKLTRSKTMQW
ncbi:ras-related and estrogen-regulated growth inhibitor [Lepisosteus oculatus]|uniref:small monomeric GTPase n=1 Tax=Lepisosteus oculatus TaxID=7918 RepID=W5MEK8_LEPOC|nr:PREDICTED: ras-related and estrogen-regulated growth inhibitor-like [Lepisosteus oculatus]XP_015194098.1 PREDICTED: ras-related and estrogen-regulated growth inhibitor-like [Lepisosteus oculatus]XP_015194099.1 PREDICTED: ras-related and estrogen-regulated growth inhibitor-like [Lepisosteus oculatus]